MKTKMLYIILIIILPAFKSQAGEFPIDTIYYSGARDSRINFVFLSDGYQQSELSKYLTDVKSSVGYFFKVTPFSNYKNYFNVFAISIPSKESGAGHPRTAADCPDSASHPKLTVNNYFGSTFDVSGVHRLLTVLRSDSVANVLKRNFPDYDQAFVLVNTPYYGGAGGTFPTSSTVSSATEIIVHEFAHSFAKVSDEYGGNCSYKSIVGPNVTQAKTYDLIPWNNWIDKSTPVPTPTSSQYQKLTGLFQGAYYCDTDWYRPMYGCKMRTLGVDYCNVCRQTLIEKIHDLVSPVETYSPTNLNLTVKDTILNFKLNLIKPVPNTLETIWTIGGTQYASGDSLIIDTKNLPAGFSSIGSMTRDTTSMTRDSLHWVKNKHSQIVAWVVFKTETGVEISSTEADLKIEVFPNPFSSKIQIKLNSKYPAHLRAELTDLNGRVVILSKLSDFNSDTNMIELNLSDYNLLTGSYNLIIFAGNQVLIKEIIKI